MALALVGSLVLAGCAGAGSFGGGGGQTVTIAIVSNSQMQDAVKLSPSSRRRTPGSS